VAAVQVDKIGDGVFHFLLACPAWPALEEVRGCLLRASRWKLAIRRQH